MDLQIYRGHELPNAWYQSIGSPLGEFAVAVQFVLKRAVFEHGSYDEENNQDSGGHGGDHRLEHTRDTENDEVESDVAGVADVDVGARIHDLMFVVGLDTNGFFEEGINGHRPCRDGPTECGEAQSCEPNSVRFEKCAGAGLHFLRGQPNQCKQYDSK